MPIGWAELLVVLVVAIVVVGPQDLPRMMRTFGRFMGQLRAMSRELQSGFDDLAREAELQALRKEVDSIRSQNFEQLASSPDPSDSDLTHAKPAADPDSDDRADEDPEEPMPLDEREALQRLPAGRAR